MAEKPQKKNEQTKKDEKQTTIAGVTVVEDQTIPHGEAHMRNQDGVTVGKITGIGTGTEKQPTTGRPSDSMGHEAKIQALKDALKRETARADDEYKRVEGALVRATKAEREAQEWQSLAGQMEKELNARKDAPPTSAELPTSGWSSERASELVRAVSVVDQPYLLGDLLELLAPHVGEAGANEGAADTLKRKLAERVDYEERFRDADKRWERAVADRDRITQDLAKLQAAMVSRRDPESGAAAYLAGLMPVLNDAARVLGFTSAGEGSLVLERVVAEWTATRQLFSRINPMVAVAVRDDSTKEIAERYSVGVLEWDGKAVKFDLLEGPARPWADLVRTMNHAVATRLVPPTFR